MSTQVISVAGTVGQILVNGQYGAVNGNVVISLDITGGFDTSLNGLTGAIFLGGINGNSISTSGNTLWISGTSGFNAATYATITNLQGASVNLSGAIAATGQQAWLAADNNARNLSGNLTQTGTQIAGIYATILNLASTGQQAWSAANNNAINLSGNLTSTGSTLRSQILSVSGLGVQTGNARSYTGFVGVGVNFVAITFSPVFPGIPSVVSSVQITGSIGYLVNPSGVTTSGYNALFSATTTETLILNTHAFYST